jgi:hypothetical protein
MIQVRFVGFDLSPGPSQTMLRIGGTPLTVTATSKELLAIYDVRKPLSSAHELEILTNAGYLQTT